MRLLNRDYGIFIRAFSASVSFIFALLTTGRIQLAQELAKRFWSHGDFKLGIRRSAWYSRRSWLNLDVSADDFFDPTEGMLDPDLKCLEDFIKSRQSSLSHVAFARDMAIIAARRLNNDTFPNHRQTHIDNFTSACDRLLNQSEETGLHFAAPAADREGDFPIPEAIEALGDFKELFPISDLRWFLISGTFLGLIRENGFLSHDYDIDFGVFEDEIDIAETIDKITASETFTLKKYDYQASPLIQSPSPGRQEGAPYILKIVHMTGVHIDLFIHYRDLSATPAVYWHGSSLHKWENSQFELVQYQLYGLDVLGPADADKYLTENYGNWRTPVTDFNCTTGTPNLTLVAHPVAIVMFIQRYIHARRTDMKQAKKLLSELLKSGFVTQDSGGSLLLSRTLFTTELAR